MPVTHRTARSPLVAAALLAVLMLLLGLAVSSSAAHAQEPGNIEDFIPGPEDPAPEQPGEPGAPEEEAPENPLAPVPEDTTEPDPAQPGDPGAPQEDDGFDNQPQVTETPVGGVATGAGGSAGGAGATPLVVLGAMIAAGASALVVRRRRSAH